MAHLGLEGLGDEKSVFLSSRKYFFVRALHTPTILPMFTYTPISHIYIYIKGSNQRYLSAAVF